MTPIRSRKHPASHYLAALVVLGAIAPITAFAADAPGAPEAADGEKPVTELTIKGHHEKYKSDQVSSPKRTEALIDTPQTVTVIRKELLDEQGAGGLTDALRNTPGITMQLGENGSTSTGDTFQMRGFSAQTALFLDGVRDLGAVSRDVFNVEQVEIAKGPAGSDIGRGASSGYINLVSKLPTLGGGNTVTASLYSQGGARVTLDSDIQTGETGAFRLNVMDQDVDVAGRSFVRNKGYGIAPSYAVGLGTDTTFYIFGQYLKQENVPDGGIPAIGEKGFYNANALLNGGKRVDRENFYGSPGDLENVEAEMLTGKVVHTFKSGAVLTNTTRYGKTDMDRTLTGVNALNVPTSSNPLTWTIARTRQRVEQSNEIFANQTNLSLTAHTGAIVHDLSVGIEVGYESQFNRTFNTTLVSTTGVTTTLAIPAANLYAPNVNDVLPVPLPTGAYTDGSTTTLAAYVFDTVKIGEQWLVNGGIRFDNYSTKTDAVAVATATSNPPLTAGTLIPSRLSKAGTLASWNVGVVYKPEPNASLYVAYGNSLTPPGGNNFALSGTASSVSNGAFKPQETDNLEAGGKWDVFGNKLSLTAAWYETVAKNELTQADPLVPNVFIQLGRRKVTGIELSAIGQISEHWQVSAGVQTLKTEIEEGTTTNSAAGAATRWSPELTGTVWTTYKASPKLTVGAGASYVGVQKRIVDPAAVIATSTLPEIPAYWVTNAMASYDLTKRVELQLNIYNVFDEHYISTLNNSGARLTLGAPLTATLTARVKF